MTQPTLIYNDTKGAEESQKAVDAVVDLVAGDPLRMKKILRLRGISAGYARMALDEANARQFAELEQANGLYA